MSKNNSKWSWSDRRKYNSKTCDRNDYYEGRLKDPHVLFVAYTLIYCFAPKENNRADFFGDFYISNTGMVIMTVIAAILCVWILIYNRKYEEYESVKWLSRGLVFFNFIGFIFFLEDYFLY